MLDALIEEFTSWTTIHTQAIPSREGFMSPANNTIMVRPGAWI